MLILAAVFVAACTPALDLTGLQLRWFDRWLKEVDNGVDQEPPVTLFVMGIDEWRTEADWPLPDTQYRPYYLHSAGQANTLHGDGTLSAEPPGDEPPDVYLYNPLRPVPTVGGQILLPGGNVNGPRDQREVELRDDVLVYSTPVLDRPVEVTGPIELRLFVASSARDTDFTGKLVDVYLDGRAMFLTEGILRARYRTSFTVLELLEPDAVYELRLDLWATANVFLPGHRIRLEVSSSNFPRFARNSNTGGEIASEAADQYRPAINRIFLLGLPAGALADVVDRRKLLLVTEGWMLLVALVLGLLTLTGHMSAWILLALTFLLGLGSALDGPAWQAIVPELVERQELPAAVALNATGFNIVRAIGPALGGLVVAAAGPAAVFLLNAVSFLAVSVAIYRWRRARVPSDAPPEEMLGGHRRGDALRAPCPRIAGRPRAHRRLHPRPDQPW